MTVVASDPLPSLTRFAENGDPDHVDSTERASVCTMIYTERGYLGLVSRKIEVQPGDILAVLFGAEPCFLLRSFGESYKLLGVCYIQGLMDGEAIDMLKEGLLEETVFKII